MIRLCTLLILLCPLISAADAPANPPPCEYAAQFTQSRQIDGLPVPLRSTGKLLVSCTHGLIWQTTDPVQQSLVYTVGKHHFRIGNGDQVERLDDLVNQNMATMLVPMLSGDLESLAERFDRDTSGTVITLTPKDATTARFLREIRVDQRADGALVEIIDGNDLSTNIDVNNVVAMGDTDLSGCQQILDDGAVACQALLFPDQVAADPDTNR